MQAGRTTHDTPFRLWLGTSSGLLAQRQHSAAIRAQAPVRLALNDASQNILVLGGTGSGKTTRVMHPLLLQLLDQHCGGLIFDIKGDFKQAVHHLARATERPIITIGPGHRALNLLAGLSPEMAASFLKSTFYLSGKPGQDSFWVDTASELCRHTLGVLTQFPEHYTLAGIYQYLFQTEFRENIQAQLEQRYEQLPIDERLTLKTYVDYHEHVYATFQDSVKAGVQSSLAQILSPFQHPDLVATFGAQGEPSVVMHDVLNGTCLLVDMPLTQWGLGGKVAYQLIKLRFYNVMLQRTQQPTWDQQRPVFFMCDEFQEIVAANRHGLSDLNFWDKSRNSKTIGIVSSQSIASFYAAIGDHDAAHALLQNFRQKLCFKTEDTVTLDTLNRLTGQVPRSRTSHAEQSGRSQNGGWFNQSRHRSTQSSTTTVDRPLIDAQLIRQLQANQALALLTLNGQSLDDIITTEPVYIDA